MKLVPPLPPLVTRPEILLHPNIPKPLHGVNPRTIKGQVWWDEQRKLAYTKTNYRCAACGVKKSEAKYHNWLEAHELYEIDYEKGRMYFKEIVALCHSCHNYIHSGRLQVLCDSGKVSKKKYHEILKHGNEIVECVKHLRKLTPKKIAAWRNWRLVFEGKEYPPVHTSYRAWLLHYGYIEVDSIEGDEEDIF